MPTAINKRYMLSYIGTGSNTRRRALGIWHNLQEAKDDQKEFSANRYRYMKDIKILEIDLECPERSRFVE